MSRNKTNYISCGACSVVANEDGAMTTSVDQLASGIKSLTSKFGHHKNGSKSVARARA